MNPIDLLALKEEAGLDKAGCTYYHLLINDFNIFNLRQVFPFHCPFEVVALTRVHPTLTKCRPRSIVRSLAYDSVLFAKVLMARRLKLHSKVVDHVFFISRLHCSPLCP